MYKTGRYCIMHVFSAQKRYYAIRSRVGVKVEELRLQDADYSTPQPPTEQFCSNSTALELAGAKSSLHVFKLCYAVARTK
ncbi:hypothetical protein F443_19048 [Phytophthora nicotianae P1569]|uniref:Uncharacterized protein n=1 Tax=Phytophthora nicotianae P1569 TaxID=1317065 RepID=V9E5W4_PHYNI|nr:hypothetical protein F443_19048 [Phytophthora nicotianae P1569]